ncbi:hypothetical protein R0K18_32815, partial [Pantoea sp. SIMBA_133]
LDGNFSGKFHIGANENQSIELEIGDMSTEGLEVSELTVADPTAEGATGGILTQESADEAITTINDAIEKVSAERSKLGAYQNR